MPPAPVAGVPDMYTAGMSLRRIACNIGQGIKDPKNPRRTVSYQAVHMIKTRFARGSGAFEDSLHPHVSEKRGIDGMQIGSADHRRCLHAIIDDATGYRMAGALTAHKDTDDVSPMFGSAKIRAGRAPAVPVPDRTGRITTRRAGFKPKNPLQKDMCHDRHIYANGDLDNNMTGRFNGGLRARDQDHARQGGRHLHDAVVDILQPHSRTWARAAR